jgi:hypothetical protein
MALYTISIEILWLTVGFLDSFITVSYHTDYEFSYTFTFKIVF